MGHHNRSSCQSAPSFLLQMCVYFHGGGESQYEGESINPGRSKTASRSEKRGKANELAERNEKDEKKVTAFPLVCGRLS